MIPAAHDRPASQLSSIRPAYELYHRALGGRHVVIEAVEPTTANPLPDTGLTVRLPARIGPDAGVDARAWYRVALAHRALHDVAGTFRFSLDHADERLRVLRARRGEGRSDLEIFLGSFADRGLGLRVFELLEDLRVDAVMRRRYGGLAGDLRRLARAAAGNRPEIGALSPRTALLEAIVRMSIFQAPHAMPAAFVRLVEAVVEPLARPTASVESVAAVTVRVYGLLARLPNLGRIADLDPADMPVEATDDGGPPWPARWPGEARVALEGDEALDVSLPRIGYRDELEARIRGNSVPPPNQQALYRLRALPTEQPAPVDPAVTSRPTERPPGPPEPLPHEHTEVVRDLHVAEPGPLAPTSPDTFVYPEWDCYRGAYRERWCRVVEHRMPVADARRTHDLQRDYAHLLYRLRRIMQDVAPDAFSVERRTRDGDDVDHDAALEAVVDQRAGIPPGENVYLRLRRRERDICVGLLVDVSSSTAERVDGAAPVRRRSVAGEHRLRPPRILDLELLGALLCMTAVDAMGDVSAAWFFSGTGREHVTMSVLKGLDEPFSDRVLRRAAAARPLHATRMGAAVRHATTRLTAAPHATKVLLVLSDGRPHDIDYGQAYGDAESLAYAAADTSRSLDDARTRGIRPFVLTVDGAGEEYLSRMCVRDYEVLHDITSLPERLTRLYRDLTGNQTTAPKRPATVA